MLFTLLQTAVSEEKHKKLNQELQCQRHNAEAARQTHETRLKEKEREFKAEISQQSDVLRDMEQQLQQERQKLQQDVNKVIRLAGC